MEHGMGSLEEQDGDIRQTWALSGGNEKTLGGIAMWGEEGAELMEVYRDRTEQGGDATFKKCCEGKQREQMARGSVRGKGKTPGGKALQAEERAEETKKKERADILARAL